MESYTFLSFCISAFFSVLGAGLCMSFLFQLKIFAFWGQNQMHSYNWLYYCDIVMFVVRNNQIILK
jgi:hypothetical protein